MKYIRNITFATTWEGDQVVATLDPLDRASFVQLSGLRERVEKDGGMAVYDVAVGILEKHLLTLSGLVDAAGMPIEKDVILSKVYFTDLVKQMFSALVDGSTLGKVTSGASGEKSPAGTEALS